MKRLFQQFNGCGVGSIFSERAVKSLSLGAFGVYLDCHPPKGFPQQIMSRSTSNSPKPALEEIRLLGWVRYHPLYGPALQRV